MAHFFSSERCVDVGAEESGICLAVGFNNGLDLFIKLRVVVCDFLAPPFLKAVMNHLPIL